MEGGARTRPHLPGRVGLVTSPGAELAALRRRVPVTCSWCGRVFLGLANPSRTGPNGERYCPQPAACRVYAAKQRRGMK